MAAYEIKLDAFEGPLDLLLHLIEKNKINIYDIPIAELTEQYMEYLGQFQEFNIEIASEFLVMAATLLQIKSRVLLPKPPKLEDAEDEELDPRQELVERLLEYRRYKEVCTVLEQMADEKARFFSRLPTVLPVRRLPLARMELDVLLEAFRAVAQSVAEAPVARVAREPFTVQDKIDDILFLLAKSRGPLLFTDLFTRSGSKNEVITTFLALLELMKLKQVAVRQYGLFAPIYITAKEEAPHVL